MSYFDTILDPRFIRGSALSVGGLFFPHRVTVLSLAADCTSNDETSPSYAPLSDVTNRPCAVGPASRSGPAASFTEYPDAREFVLLTFAPLVCVGMQAILTRAGGTISTHKIEAVEHEGNNCLTRLTVTKLN